MKGQFVVAIAICFFAIASVHAKPQGSIVLSGEKPLSGPDRRPSLNLDYSHRIIDNDRTKVNAYGGGNWQQGGRVSPHGGVNFEHQIGRKGNGFVGGFGQVQPGPGGRLSPSAGVRGGFRFRRDLEFEEQENFQDESLLD